MKVSELIKNLEDIKKDYGDLKVYEYDDGILLNYKNVLRSRPAVRKVYYTNWGGMVDIKLETGDKELYNVNPSKPINIGLVL